MGDPSFHVRGRGCPAALHSSSHGAGRVLGREQARRQVTVPALEKQMAGIWFDRKHARRLCEEAPAAYKDIRQVIKEQRKLVRVVRQVRPVINYKG